MYILDANTYIQAKNFHYKMSFCPAYWQWLDSEYKKSNLLSISSVYEELVEYGDELSDWVKDHRYHFHPVTSDNIQDKFAEVVQHVYNLQNQGKKLENINNFLSKADPWLIASAACLGGTIVTHEVLDPETSKKVKIPNVCKEFNVPYINTYELLDKLDASFVLAS